MSKKVILWSPTNGKQSFDEGHAAKILAMQESRIPAKRRWFKYDGQDKQDSKKQSSNLKNGIGHSGHSGDTKKRKGSEPKGDT